MLKVYDIWGQIAPRLKPAKRACGLTDREISRRFNRLCYRKAGRAQINHFFTGRREPTISQFFVLCEIIRADPARILFDLPHLPRSDTHGTATSEAQA